LQVQVDPQAPAAAPGIAQRQAAPERAGEDGAASGAGKGTRNRNGVLEAVTQEQFALKYYELATAYDADASSGPMVRRPTYKDMGEALVPRVDGKTVSRHVSRKQWQWPPAPPNIEGI
jgi:hypothetical protein